MSEAFSRLVSSVDGFGKSCPGKAFPGTRNVGNRKEKPELPENCEGPWFGRTELDSDVNLRFRPGETSSSAYGETTS